MVYTLKFASGPAETRKATGVKVVANSFVAEFDRRPSDAELAEALDRSIGWVRYYRKIAGV